MSRPGLPTEAKSPPTHDALRQQTRRRRDHGQALDSQADCAFRDFSTVDCQDCRLAASPEMIQVGAYPTRSDAELAQTALVTAGIPSVVESDDAGGAYPFDLTGAARLLVHERDAADAVTLLSERPHAQGKERR